MSLYCLSTMVIIRANQLNRRSMYNVTGNITTTIQVIMNSTNDGYCTLESFASSFRCNGNFASFCFVVIVSL